MIFIVSLQLDGSASQRYEIVNVANHFILNYASNSELYILKHWFLIYAETTFFIFYIENYLSNKKKMHLDSKSNHIFLFRIFMHFDFLLIIGKVLSSSSVASPYSIRALNCDTQVSDISSSTGRPLYIA